MNIYGLRTDSVHGSAPPHTLISRPPRCADTFFLQPQLFFVTGVPSRARLYFDDAGIVARRPPGEDAMTIQSLCRAPLSACITAVAGMCLSAAALADLPVEELSVVPAVTAKNRTYVSDVAINHISDGKLHVVDTDTGTYLGVIGSGFIGQVTYSPDGNDILIATGYLSRGQRGDRTDILEVWEGYDLK